VADNKKNPTIPAKRLTVAREYLYANLLFWGFLAILAVISFFTCGGVWDDVTSGVMEFIFVILGGGFTLVSMLDYLYEKHMSDSIREAGKS
jgi:uncharacterized membrane-anchored protein